METIEMQRVAMGLAFALLCLALAAAIIGLLWLIRHAAREEQNGRDGRSGNDVSMAGDAGADPARGRVVVAPGNKTVIQVIEVPASARRTPDYGPRYSGKNGDHKDAVSRQGKGR